VHFVAAACIGQLGGITAFRLAAPDARAWKPARNGVSFAILLPSQGCARRRTAVVQVGEAGRVRPRGICARRVTMKLSARNQVAGKVLSITKGATTAHVKIEIAPGIVLTSSITNEAVEELGLTVGKAVTAIVKSSDVMVGV
jgi:molybdopterin-binding protein